LLNSLGSSLARYGASLREISAGHRDSKQRSIEGKRHVGGQAQDRTADLFFFREALYRLSYLTGITQFTSS
jgi:hypothetical protein